MYVEKTYKPKNSTFEAHVLLTPYQASVVDELFKKDNFTAAFWAEKIALYNSNDTTADGEPVARINGEHYILVPDHEGMFKGMGGRRITIEFTEGAHKGKVITCRNTWAQGTIPSELHHLLPDNATFVRDIEARKELF